MPDAETGTTTDTNDDDDDFHQVETLIPWEPIIDDDTAMIAAHAVIELVARRTPDILGDNLAELHALTSLLHQLHDWITPTIADALDQHHTPNHILALLTANPSRPDTQLISPATQASTPAQTRTYDQPRRRHVHNGETLATQGFPGDNSR